MTVASLCPPLPRWTKTLVSRVSQGDQQLAIRAQGPYADPPAHVGQPDGVVLVAGELEPLQWCQISVQGTA